MGVHTSDTTAPVLVLNLRWRGGPYAAAWMHHAERGEPLRLTLRGLAGAEPDPTQGVVSVCENPAVLESAAEVLGPRCRPLVCIEGHPTSAALALLGRLADCGLPLRYHGDLDWAGITIANGLHQRFPELRAWRFDRSAVLRQATLPGPALNGSPVAASWDPGLAPALAERGRALHEEAVLAELLRDLDAG